MEQPEHKLAVPWDVSAGSWRISHLSHHTDASCPFGSSNHSWKGTMVYLVSHLSHECLLFNRHDIPLIQDRGNKFCLRNSVNIHGHPKCEMGFSTRSYPSGHLTQAGSTVK